MSGFLSVVNRVFTLLLGPLQSAPPLMVVLGASWLTGVLMLLLFRFASNQRELKRVKNQMQAHLLAVRLFQEQAGVILRAQGRILRSAFTYLRHSLKPVALAFVPLVILLIQLDAYLGWLPPAPGQDFVLGARVKEAAALDQLSLRLPDGLALSAPPVRTPEEREIAWRINAARSGQFLVEVVIGGEAFVKKVTVAADLARVSTSRVRGSLLEQFLHPDEPPLPAGSPLDAIEAPCRRRAIDLYLFEAHWLLPFFVFSLVAGYAMKGFLRTEI